MAFRHSAGIVGGSKYDEAGGGANRLCLTRTPQFDQATTYGGYFLSLFVNTWLLNWCFEPSQPLVITSGLKETFIKRYILKRTNKAEKRPEEPSEKTESCRQNLWNEIQLKGP